MAFSSQPIDSSPADHFEYLVEGMAEAIASFIGKGFDRYSSQIATPAGLSHVNNMEIGRELFLQFGGGTKPNGKRIPTQNGKHVTGVDCAWTAPKWVSALMAISSEEERAQIQAEWDEHVLMLFDRLEAKAKTSTRCIATPAQSQHATRRQGSTTERLPAELIGFVAKHHLARPTDETENAGRSPDPHLHTHIFIFNMAWLPDPKHKDGGTWRAVDDYGIKQMAGQIAYESEGDFSRRLEDLGYRPTYIEDRKGARRSHMEELKEHCLFWSSGKRREKKVIEDFEAKYLRPPTKAELRKAMLWTRHVKAKDEQVVDWEWVLRGAQEAGLDTSPVIPRRKLSRLPLATRERELFKRLYAANGLCGQSNDAVFRLKDLDLAVARCAVGLGMTIEEQDAFREKLKADLVPVNVDPRPERCTWTTKTNLRDEFFIEQRLSELALAHHPVPTREAIEEAIRSLEADGIVLDDEQRAIVYRACEPGGLLFIEGWAGTGKTTAMLAAVRALRTQINGITTADRIIAISTARDTAIRTGTKLEAENLDSIESFCLGVRRKKIKPTERTVIFLDEAVMVDNERMAMLLQHSGPAKLVCIGDRKQLQCIGAGGWYEDAAKRYGVMTLTKVHRQINQEDVAMLFNLRSGKSEAMLASLAERDRLHVLATPEERIGQVVADFIADRDAGRAINDIKIVTDGSNKTIDSLNRIIQTDRIRRGELTGEGYKMISVKTEREWTVYVGDEVSFYTGYYHKDSGIYVPNGKRARVLEIDYKKDIIWVQVKGFSGPTPLHVSHETMEQAITPDYAIHALRLQGGEAPIIRAMPGCGTTGLEPGYSQTSRGIEEIHVYVDAETHSGDDGKTDPVWMLTQRWKKAQPKISARTRMMWAKSRSKCQAVAVDEHLDLGPTRPSGDSWAQPVEHKPWLERDRKTRFVTTRDGITMGIDR